MRYACNCGEPGKSTSARTFVNPRKSDHAAGELADIMVDALSFEATRATIQANGRASVREHYAAAAKQVSHPIPITRASRGARAFRSATPTTNAERPGDAVA